MNLSITKNRTFKGVTFHLEENGVLPLTNAEFFMIISLGSGFDSELELNSMATEGSRLIKRGDKVEIYLTADDTAKLYDGLEYEVGIKVDGDTETLFVGGIDLTEGKKV